MVESLEKGKATDTIERVNFNKKIQNKLKSPFISQQKEWEDEDQFPIPKDILKGITTEIQFPKPSKIQAVAIPMILKKNEEGGYDNLIAQSKNGSGKTGAFTIGSLLRVDPKILKIQIIVLCHTRELANQIYQVYQSLVKFAPDYKIVNLITEGAKPEGHHIVVSTLGKLKSFVSGGGGRGRGQKGGADKPQGGSLSIDLSELKAVVVDEADFFFSDQNNYKQLQELHGIMQDKQLKYQYILFSATYSEEITELISEVINDANQISLKTEQLSLDHIQQFEYKCEHKKKIDFIQQIFEICQMTQTVIFVNTKKFAETLHNILRKNGYKSTIIFSDMSNEERDLYVEKFRKQEVNVVITTNLLARGIDVPEIELVINFDVPKFKDHATHVFVADTENYLHRIGRAGRFGVKGVAVTIYDNEEDEKLFWETIEFYKMKDKVKKLDNPKQLKEILESLGATQGV